MRNKLVICLAALLLTACATQEMTAETQTTAETAEVTATETEAETTAETIAETTIETTTETTAEETTVTTTEAYEETVSESVDYAVLYSEKLEEIMQSEYYDPAIYAFDLFDIDSDGTPELFAADSTVRIFTVVDGEISQLTYVLPTGEGGDLFGLRDNVRVTSDGYIANYSYGMGIYGFAHYDYFRYENGKITFDSSTEFGSSPDGDYYIVNGESTTKEGYNAVQALYDGMDWYRAGRKYVLDYSGISEALGIEFVEEAVEETADHNAIYTAKLEEIMQSKGFSRDMYTIESKPLPEDMYAADAMGGYELADLDSDGIQELVFSGGVYHQCTVQIYKIKDNEAVIVDINDEEKELLCNPMSKVAIEEGCSLELGSSGVINVSDNGYIHSEYSGMGASNNDYFRFENGELIRIASLRSHLWYVDDDGNERELYCIDGAEVTKEEYESAKAEYDAMDWEEVGLQSFFMPAALQ
ncbi:MAG: hypothetical protein J6A37_06610 [Oscillospiraceae bacterium]|nr:hypothetical protein [Oscillospiraceae bacterium]